MRILAPLFFLLVSLFAQGTPADDRIYDQVRRKLALDRDVGGGVYDVTVKNGAVVLKGRVRTDKIKEKAEKIVRKVKGVTGVTNQLEVRLTA